MAPDGPTVAVRHHAAVEFSADLHWLRTLRRNHNDWVAATRRPPKLARPFRITARPGSGTLCGWDDFRRILHSIPLVSRGGMFCVSRPTPVELRVVREPNVRLLRSFS